MAEVVINSTLITLSEPLLGSNETIFVDSTQEFVNVSSGDHAVAYLTYGDLTAFKETIHVTFTGSDKLTAIRNQGGLMRNWPAGTQLVTSATGAGIIDYRTRSPKSVFFNSSLSVWSQDFVSEVWGTVAHTTKIHSDIVELSSAYPSVYTWTNYGKTAGGLDMPFIRFNDDGAKPVVFMTLHSYRSDEAELWDVYKYFIKAIADEHNTAATEIKNRFAFHIAPGIGFDVFSKSSGNYNANSVWNELQYPFMWEETLHKARGASPMVESEMAAVNSWVHDNRPEDYMGYVCLGDLAYDTGEQSQRYLTAITNQDYYDGHISRYMETAGNRYAGTITRLNSAEYGNIGYTFNNGQQYEVYEAHRMISVSGASWISRLNNRPKMFLDLRAQYLDDHDEKSHPAFDALHGYMMALVDAYDYTETNSYIDFQPNNSAITLINSDPTMQGISNGVCSYYDTMTIGCSMSLVGGVARASTGPNLKPDHTLLNATMAKSKAYDASSYVYFFGGGWVDSGGFGHKFSAAIQKMELKTGSFSTVGSLEVGIRGVGATGGSSYWYIANGECSSADATNKNYRKTLCYNIDDFSVSSVLHTMGTTESGWRSDLLHWYAPDEKLYSLGGTQMSSHSSYPYWEFQQSKLWFEMDIGGGSYNWVKTTGLSSRIREDCQGMSWFESNSYFLWIGLNIGGRQLTQYGEGRQRIDKIDFAQPRDDSAVIIGNQGSTQKWLGMGWVPSEDETEIFFFGGCRATASITSGRPINCSNEFYTLPFSVAINSSWSENFNQLLEQQVLFRDRQNGSEVHGKIDWLYAHPQGELTGNYRKGSGELPRGYEYKLLLHSETNKLWIVGGTRARFGGAESHEDIYINTGSDSCPLQDNYFAWDYEKNLFSVMGGHSRFYTEISPKQTFSVDLGGTLSFGVEIKCATARTSSEDAHIELAWMSVGSTSDYGFNSELNRCMHTTLSIVPPASETMLVSLPVTRIHNNGAVFGSEFKPVLRLFGESKDFDISGFYVTEGEDIPVMTGGSPSVDQTVLDYDIDLSDSSKEVHGYFIPTFPNHHRSDGSSKIIELVNSEHGEDYNVYITQTCSPIQQGWLDVEVRRADADGAHKFWVNYRNSADTAVVSQHISSGWVVANAKTMVSRYVDDRIEFHFTQLNDTTVRLSLGQYGTYVTEDFSPATSVNSMTWQGVRSDDCPYWVQSVSVTNDTSGLSVSTPSTVGDFYIGANSETPIQLEPYDVDDGKQSMEHRQVTKDGSMFRLWDASSDNFKHYGRIKTTYANSSQACIINSWWSLTDPIGWGFLGEPALKSGAMVNKTSPVVTYHDGGDDKFYGIIKLESY